MKRSYDEMVSTLTDLPQNIFKDGKIFKVSLEGSHILLVEKAVDISKATVKPIDDIDEPEEEQDAVQKRLDKTNTRMIQLNLKDNKGTAIGAIECETIDYLTHIQPGWTISIKGPVEVRCGNLMLEKNHVTGINPPIKPEVQVIQTDETKSEPVEIIDATEDWDEDDEDDCIVLN